MIKTSPWEDLTALPRRMIGEIINGQLYAHPRPGSRDSLITFTLCVEILSEYRKHWWIMSKPSIELEDHVLSVPVAGWMRKKINGIPDGPMTCPPDWICEIETPATQSYIKNIKMPLYQSLGVQHLWLVNTQERRIDVWLWTEGEGWWKEMRQTYGELRALPFEDAGVDVDRLFNA